ncbi:hypothetical protein V6N13_001035 [Hibiscus sabdariffa]
MTIMTGRSRKHNQALTHKHEQQRGRQGGNDGIRKNSKRFSNATTQIQGNRSTMNGRKWLGLTLEAKLNTMRLVVHAMHDGFRLSELCWKMVGEGKREIGRKDKGKKGF